MVRRASSPILVGRRAESEALRSAVAAASEMGPRIILVGGEAGIGKSRFIEEFAREARAARTRIIVGRCIELAQGSLPYAPIVEILDAIVADGNDPLAQRAGRLFDELSGSVEGSRPTSAGSRGRLFLELRNLLVTTAGDGRLIVVLEDLHWADQSTLDLVTYLSTRLRATRVFVVLVYRSDELHRQHALRPVLAQLRRDRIIDAIALEPLPAESTLEQIEAILGKAPEASFAKRVIDLADGNPFHVEELVALGGPLDSLPVALRDVLLVRIERLHPAARSIVRRAAVIGRDVDESLLAAVSDISPTDLRAGLETALEAFVLEATDDGRRYRFRHELLRESAYEDMLPADRIALHRRIADALGAGAMPGSDSPAAAAAELARHRDAGRQFDRAREAYRVAGELALSAHAWTEAAAAFERLLEIDAAGDIEPGDIDLTTIRHAAQAIYLAGHGRQALELLRTTLEHVQHRLDPLIEAEGWLDLARIRNDSGDDPGSREAIRRAGALVPKRPLSRVRLRLVAENAAELMFDAQYRAAIRLADPTIRGAEEMGALDVLVYTLAQRGTSLLALGHHDAAARDMERGRRIGETLDDPDPLGVVLFNIGSTFGHVGAFEVGLDVLAEGSARAVDLGVERSWEPWLRCMTAEYAFWLGRWDEADAQAARARSFDLDGMTLSTTANVEAALAAHRGDHAGADRALADAARCSTPTGDLAGWWRATQAKERLIAGKPLEAIAWVDDALGILANTDDIATRARLASLGAEAAADVAEGTSARRDAKMARAWIERATVYVALAEDVDRGHLVRGSLGSPLTHAYAVHATAHARRAAGLADPDAWLASVEAFEAIRMAPLAAHARYRLGEAHVLAGDRAAAREALRSARDIAIGIGIPTLKSSIDGLARRARLDLEHEARPDAESPSSQAAAERARDPWGLSAREQEVLALVGDGLTNREIARRLFITEKTASVHVTHILDKLGVSSRTEAALVAVRAGTLTATDAVGR